MLALSLIYTNVMTVDLFAIAVVVFFSAGLIKGTVGIGLPTIVISILSTVTDPRLAMATTLIPIFFANLLQFYRANSPKKLVIAYWPFMLMLVSFNYVVSQLSFAVDTSKILLALGIVVLVFAASSLVKQPPRLPEHWDRPIQFGAGVTAGLMGGLTNIWGPPMVMYFVSKRLSKEAFISATGAVLTVGSLPLIVSYGQAGLLPSSTILGSIALVVPVFVGMRLGEILRKRINTELFIKLLLIVFLLLGLNLIRRALV